MAQLRFQFDKRIPEEAALLERLQQLPEDRHIEFIRNLAVKGFLQESAETRGAAHNHGPDRHDHDAPQLATQPAPEPHKPLAMPHEVEAAGDMTLASLKQLVS